MTEDRILDKGTTAWRIERADRLAFLVDAAAYFEAFVDTVSRARRSVLILAWDIDSRLRLLRDGADHAYPLTLVDFLSALVEERPDLEIHVLCWDYSVIYTFERELMTRLKIDWRTHDRLHFRFDDHHPTGASLHEKLVVVDDRVAFVGGIDLGRRRWDTPEHRPHDARRVSPTGASYPPFHDLQAVVSGAAAGALGELARERWRRATGEALANAEVSDPAWPDTVEPAIEDIDVGIVRTRPKYHDQEESLETLELHLRAIAAARESIFIENQYLTSEKISKALAKQLGGSNAPDTVMVTPRSNSGWLEQATMGALRHRFCERLRAAAGADLCRVYYPTLSEDLTPNVHSKLLIVDDRIAYLGSANLSNRSMALDSECGLALDARDREDAAAALAHLRCRLLAEHLASDRETVAERTGELGLVGGVESLRGGTRTLEVLETEAVEIADQLEPVARLADPQSPLDPSELIHDLIGW